MRLVVSLLPLALLASDALAAGQLLAPDNDIISPPGQNAREPLKWLGANGPWFRGEDINSVPPTTPPTCKISQAAYISRHGSRYPDEGAYSTWLEMHSRFSSSISSKNYTFLPPLSFLPTWTPVLGTDDNQASSQIAMENPTGAQESHSYGYRLRTRYPQLYNHGDPFYVWANNYTRVLQTAQLFAQGFLGFRAATDGVIVSVTSNTTLFPEAVGDSLAPSDGCPLFSDDEGEGEVGIWNRGWIPGVRERLGKLIIAGEGEGQGEEEWEFTDNDISQMPYLCGFESAITGRLSEWCDVFTDEELRSYQYSNDLRYWYGVGPGSKALGTKMMTPYLDALLGVLEKGPATSFSSSSGEYGGNGEEEEKKKKEFQVPKLLVTFLNDGQLIELITASGVFEDQESLDPEEMDEGRRWVGNRFVTMRGTIAFERLTCGGAEDDEETNYIRILLNDVVYPLPFCKSGPGASCRLSEYVAYIKDKYAREGNWLTNCNVTMPSSSGTPTPPTETVVKGASFYTDLTSPWVKTIDVFSPTW